MVAKRITIGRAGRRKVFFDPKRRSTHLHVIGGPGMGKTKFLEHMIREDILAGHGLCLIDPHGDLFRSIVDWCASKNIQRFRKIHIIDPSLTTWRTGFNPLAHYDGERPLHRVDSMLEALAQVWGGEDPMSTPSIRSALRAVLKILIDNKYTLAEAFPLTALVDHDGTREFLTNAIDDPISREMWRGYEQAAAKAPREFIAEFSGPRRRLFELLHDEQIREMLGQVDIAIDFRKVMEDGDIVLVNLSENAVDESRGRALGALLLREMFLVAKRRNPKTAEANPFYLYVDECAQYLTKDISKLLAQTRKFGLHAILAHQWLEQLREASPDIFAAVMAIQNKVVFGGLADVDAAILSDELFRTEYDIEMPVEMLVKPAVVGVVQTWLHNWSNSDTEGDSESTGDSSASSDSSGMTQLYDADGFPIGGFTSMSGSGTSTGSSSSTGHSRSTTSTSGESEAYIPKFENLPSAVHSLDNVRHLATVRLRMLPEQHAIVKGPALPSFEMVTYSMSEVVIHEDSRVAFLNRTLTASPYSLTADDARKVIVQRANTIEQDADTWRSAPSPPDAPDEWRG